MAVLLCSRHRWWRSVIIDHGYNSTVASMSLVIFDQGPPAGSYGGEAMTTDYFGGTCREARAADGIA